MHSQCIRNVEIWEFVCDGCKSIWKFKICNHIRAQYTKVKHKLRICQEYKSEALADNKDLHVMQIPNLAEQFLVDTYLLSNATYIYELTEPAN